MTRPFRTLIPLLLAAGLAVPAVAQQGGQIVPRPGGRDALLVQVLDRQVDYVVTDLLGAPGFETTEDTARFRVLSTVPYTVTIGFPTWQPAPPAPANYRQPAFSDGAHRIGGRVYLDRDRAGGGRGRPDWLGPPGRPDWLGETGPPDWLDDPGRPGRPGRPGGGGSGGGEARIYQDADGRLAAQGARGAALWGVGADLGPRFTDNPTGLPAPGIYSLEVEITLQPR